MDENLELRINEYAEKICAELKENEKFTINEIIFNGESYTVDITNFKHDYIKVLFNLEIVRSKKFRLLFFKNNNPEYLESKKDLYVSCFKEYVGEIISPSDTSVMGKILSKYSSIKVGKFL